MGREPLERNRLLRMPITHAAFRRMFAQSWRFEAVVIIAGRVASSQPFRNGGVRTMAGAWWLGENDLDEDQKGVIEIAAEGNHLVVGPPGSGKTNILLLRAKYLTLADTPNIAIVVFTKTLSRFIASGGRDYGFPADKITTCAKWQRELLREYGALRAIPSGSFEEQRSHLTQQLSSLVAKRNLSNLYDAILQSAGQAAFCRSRQQATNI
jgi:hypothetical protein